MLPFEEAYTEVVLKPYAYAYHEYEKIANELRELLLESFPWIEEVLKEFSRAEPKFKRIYRGRSWHFVYTVDPRVLASYIPGMAEARGGK